MGQARDVVDRSITEVHAHPPGQVTTVSDLAPVAEIYAADAVAVTPDQGEITGRESIVEWYKQALDAFPDQEYEILQKHESDNAAITEGYVTGTNTVPLRLPSGESIPATGRRIRIRTCSVATVEDGLITRQHFYFDQMEVLEQLGLLPEQARLPLPVI